MPKSDSAPPATAGGSWSAGQRVLAQWFPENFFYPGTIESVKGGQFNVRFDDGDQEWTTISMVRVER